MPLAFKCSEKENISRCNRAIACKCLGTSGQIAYFSEPLNSLHYFNESLTSTYAFNHAEKSHINLGAPENIQFEQNCLHFCIQLHKYIENYTRNAACTFVCCI